MTSTRAAATALQDHVALWSAGEAHGTDVVTAACTALVAGLDTPGLRVLAACTRAEADYDVQVTAEVTAEADRLAATRTPGPPG